MAEIKNSFLQAKMNLDLDDRVIPNGQYREAYNVVTGRSEDSDVGALENIQGNVLVAGTDLRAQLSNNNIDSIGYIVDNENNRVIVFVTDFDGSLGGSPILTTNYCAIWSCNFNTTVPVYTKLVDGSFLNFSKKSPIYGINLIENLLFWSDNRNQPRKINTTLALTAGYYTTEVQISVAKYNPYEVINLIKTATSTVVTKPSTTTFTVANPAGIEIGMTVIGPGLDGSNYTFVTNIAGSLITIDVNPSPGTITIADKLIFLKTTMTNETSNATWPGDPDYLKSRYVRFSYRFKFDDGEYSITAPFTQIAYIPEQKGFFVSGDEEATYRSTVINFMQNNVQNVQLIVPLPDKFNNIINSYKITEIDVLYKQSDQTAIKVLESIMVDTASAEAGVLGNLNTFTYNYQSRKPYKTLPEAQTTRVYDRVPTRALAQESAGNRIIYGNYRDIYTPPLFLEYTVAVVEKQIDYYNGADSFIEYPNHTLKQNRNYQVGFVLADKYGRQSSVILSKVNLAAASGFGGSTVYSPYKASAVNMKEWFGDALQVSVNAPIISGINGQPDFATGEPGLYAAPNANGGLGFAIATGSFTTTAPFQYTFTLNASYALNNVVPVVNLTSLRGGLTDYVKVTNKTGSGLGPYVITTDGVINNIYTYNPVNVPDIKYAYAINEIGWYSYKIVVKQVDQDYYNCYLPGMLNGYPLQTAVTFPTNEAGKTAHIVLLNDNINKIPRDLSEVGPDQKQYRSSVLLYGRVNNNTATTNTQYYPGNLFHVASTIANANDLNMQYASLSSDGKANLYQMDTQPIIARISTSSAIGTISSTGIAPTPTPNMLPILSVYETKPIESLIDIYYETSSEGLISDINDQVLNTFSGPATLIGFSYLQKEWQDPSGVGSAKGAANSKYVTDNFTIANQASVVLPTAIITSMTVLNGLGANVSPHFNFEQLTVNGPYRLYIVNPFTYLYNSITTDVFTFSLNISYSTASGTFNNTLTASGALTNIIPNIPTSPQNFVAAANDTNIGTIVGGVNGAFSNTVAGLYYTLTFVSGPASPATFQIDGATGAITQSAMSSQTPGIYNYTVTATDATTALGVTSGGFLTSNTVNVEITLGSVPVVTTYPWSFSVYGSSSSNGACSVEPVFQTLWSTVPGPLALGDFLYIDNLAQDVFVGGNFWYSKGFGFGQKSYQIGGTYPTAGRINSNPYSCL